jgi:diguanylate cyclase (GGDEF)-like protein
MANQSRTETAKLSLVGQHSHAVAFTTPEVDSNQNENILARLPSILQTTIELDALIQLFHDEIQQVIPYDSFHYQHREASCDINTAKRSHHVCTYRLEMNTVWLGELTLTRGKKFSHDDTQLIEDLLCKLIYPLRNCLLYRQAHLSALQDALTGLNNRAAFDASLAREVDLSQRQHSPLSLIILDIDHFKTVNDSYGHSAGDLALKTLAESLTHSLRRSDIAFRYGGEEFSLILSNTDKEAAHVVAERIRTAITQLRCDDGTRSFGMTISLGVTELQQGENAASLFDRADQALYQAKHTGRNKTITA